MIGAICVLAVVIGIVLARGDQLHHPIRIGSAARVVYLGPIDAKVQNLWLVDPASPGNVQKLTDSQYGVLDYDVAPDGSLIYSEGTQAGASNLLIYDAATSESRLLYACQDASCMNIAVRPDGKAIAFDHSALNTNTDLPPGAARVWLMNRDGGSAAPLFKDSQQLGYTAVWTPDGSRVAVFDTNAGGMVIHDFANNTDRLVPALQGTVGTFSPDGTRIWFPKVVTVGDQFYVTHLVIVDLSVDPVLQHDLAPDTSAVDDSDAIWTHDGRALIVPRRDGKAPTQERQIVRVDVPTGASKMLMAESGYTYSNLRLNAAGDKLVYERLQLGTAGARYEIWLLDLVSGASIKLAEDAVAPHWLP